MLSSRNIERLPLRDVHQGSHGDASHPVQHLKLARQVESLWLVLGALARHRPSARSMWEVLRHVLAHCFEQSRPSFGRTGEQTTTNRESELWSDAWVCPITERGGRHSSSSGWDMLCEFSECALYVSIFVIIKYYYLHLFDFKCIIISFSSLSRKMSVLFLNPECMSNWWINVFWVLMWWKGTQTVNYLCNSSPTWLKWHIQYVYNNCSNNNK